MTAQTIYLFLVILVLAFVGEVRCLPAGLPGDGTAILLRVDQEANDDDDGFMDREKRDASGQTEILPDDEHVTDTQLPSKPEIMQLYVESRVTARFASTVVTSKLKNVGRQAAEATFTMTLPEDAFISEFSMTIEGVVYHSVVKPKKVAQKKYNEAKARGHTAGQVKQSSPDKFTVSVAVAAQSSVLFNITYQQLLRRKNGMFEHRINIQPGQVVPDVHVEVHVVEPQGIKELNASWLLSDKSDQAKLNDITSIDIKPGTAHVLFSSKGEGVLNDPRGIMGEFVVKYDVVHNLTAGHMEIVNGYFVHYFSPVGLPTTRKNVVFVIDTSGSMGGRKIEQTKHAFSTILDDVRPIDEFNIVLFSSSIRVWKDNEMVNASKENIDQGKVYVNEIRAGGGTNLYDGLMKAIDLLMEHGNEDALPLIIMLTDGQPTSGPVTNTADIIARVTDTIEGRLSLFSVGFGEGVDYGFLEKLSLSNQALARKVYEDSSASAQMKGFYDEVANPLLFNVNIDYNNQLVDEASLTKSTFMAYFDGTEIVVAGKLKDDIINAVWNASKDANGNNIATENPKLSVVITGKSLDTDIKFNLTETIQKDRSLHQHEVDDYAQRLWAYLTIKNLLQQRKTVNSKQMKDALSERALNLSLKYHFVTPLTSLLVIKPEDVLQDDGHKTTERPITSLASSALPLLHLPVAVTVPPVAHLIVLTRYPIQTQGLAYHPTQRSPPTVQNIKTSKVHVKHLVAASSVDSDPRFMITIPNTDVTVCFDISGQPGDVISLLDDPVLDLSVSAYVISVKPHGNNKSPAIRGKESAHQIRTFFGKIGVRLGRDYTLVFTPDAIVVNGDAKYGWDEDHTMHLGRFLVELRHTCHVVIRYSDAVIVAVMVHRAGEREAKNGTQQTDHLGFYVQDSRGLSDRVHGLMGQFQRNRDVSVPSEHDGINMSVTANMTTTLSIDGRSVLVTRKKWYVPLIRSYRECWHAADHAKGLIDGDYVDYKLAHLNARPTRRG